MLGIGDATFDRGGGAEIDVEPLRKRVAVRHVNLAHADDRNQQQWGLQVGAPLHAIGLASNDGFQSITRVSFESGN